MCIFAAMKHLVIRNLGPLKEADIELQHINVIIGSQSSGKSCVLKTACYCTWVEKRIELTQTADFFEKDGNFLKELERFHKLKGYIKADTFISYESDYMSFSYENSTKAFSFNWKEGRWNYCRSKVTYIPAERNLVAAIPNWFQVKFNDDNIRDFMADWEAARQATTNDLSVLNLGVSYHYDANSKSDKVQVGDGVTLDFTNTSSGLQSVIPLYVHLNYCINNKENFSSIEHSAEYQYLSEVLYEELFRKENKGDDRPSIIGKAYAGVKIYKEWFLFQTQEYADEFRSIYDQYTKTSFCDIFLEEPEANLFPPTQANLVEWLLEINKGEQPNNLFIATHSPYILGTFMEKKDIAMTLLYTRMSEEQMIVKTATEQDIQDIYDYGVDAFFNIESLG